MGPWQWVGRALVPARPVTGVAFPWKAVVLGIALAGLGVATAQGGTSYPRAASVPAARQVSFAAANCRRASSMS